ncbi:MAG: tail fiber domain-containing protein [Anaerolineales bacterium]|nr:tail fiber domain-containing protein [Anaerolineales bacterium]
MRKLHPLLLTAFTLLFTTLACNLPSAGPQVAAQDDGGAIEPTVAAGVATATDQVQPEEPPVTELPPSQTPTPSATPTVTPTPTSSIPMVRVSQNTNCRSGPGTVYDLIYVFMIGDEAEIIARSSAPNYVIIEVPDGSGEECWLWMQYGEQTGSTDGLPERTPPPTPTPAATATPEINFTIGVENINLCAGDEYVFIRITNTGPIKLESGKITALNVDTSQTVSQQTNMFGSTPNCISVAITAIDPGASGYSSAGFTPFIAGHTINITYKACAGDGLAEPCLTKSISYAVPFVSDKNAKANFEPVDSGEILALVSELPITTWNYTDSNLEGRHIGPMAQDFNELFGFGDYDEYISAVDSSGVALVAIQGLSDLGEKQAQRIAALQSQNEVLQAQNDALNARVDALEAKGAPQSGVQWSVFVPALALAGLSIALLLGMRMKLGGHRRD